MNIRNFIKVNIINLVILGLVVLSYFVFDLFADKNSSLPTVATLIFGLVWAAYTIYSNYSVLKGVSRSEYDDFGEVSKKKDIIKRLNKVGNARMFVDERSHLTRMYESLISREDYVMKRDKDSRLRELYELSERQMLRNIINATEYLATFDYISGRDSGYARKMCEENQELLDKFNKFIELSVTYDDTFKEFDTRELDDMIESLQKMRDNGKGTLGV